MSYACMIAFAITLTVISSNTAVCLPSLLFLLFISITAFSMPLSGKKKQEGIIFGLRVPMVHFQSLKLFIVHMFLEHSMLGQSANFTRIILLLIINSCQFILHRHSQVAYKGYHTYQNFSSCSQLFLWHNFPTIANSQHFNCNLKFRLTWLLQIIISFIHKKLIFFQGTAVGLECLHWICLNHPKMKTLKSVWLLAHLCGLICGCHVPSIKDIWISHSQGFTYGRKSAAVHFQMFH